MRVDYIVLSFYHPDHHNPPKSKKYQNNQSHQLNTPICVIHTVVGESAEGAVVDAILRLEVGNNSLDLLARQLGRVVGGQCQGQAA